MLLNHRRALRVAGACLLGAAVMLVLVLIDTTLAGLQVVDDAWLDGMEAVRNPVLVEVAKAFAIAGGVWVNWPLRVAALVLLAVRHRWLQLAAFSLALVTSEALIGPLKSVVARPRPPDPLMESTNFSFPSGHAVAGAVTAVGLVLVLLDPGPKRWSWEIRAAVFAVLMAGSRTYLGVHWLSDVVGGGLIGTGLAVGWPALLQLVRERRRAAAVRDDGGGRPIVGGQRDLARERVGRATWRSPSGRGRSGRPPRPPPSG